METKKLAVIFKGQPELDSNQGEHTLWIKDLSEDGYTAGTEADAILLTDSQIELVLGWLREDAATDDYPFVRAVVG